MPDEKPNDTAQSTQDEKLAGLVSASVTAGLKTALPELMKPFADQISGGSIRREVQQPVRAAQIAEVNEDDIANAIEAGDKALVSKLLKQQRAADRQRADQEIQRITSAGGAAFGSVSRMAADKLPYYSGKYKKLIDEKVEQFQANNPGVMVTPEHYKAAHDIVVGENISDIQAADREEAIRKSREPDPALLPSGGRVDIEPEEREPENLAQVLAGDWKKEFRVKQRAVGGRSDDEELRKFGIAGGLKEFVGVRKQMEALEDETNGSLGLDRDFRDENGRVHGDRGFQPKTARFE
jgi:hypothetical protein